MRSIFIAILLLPGVHIALAQYSDSVHYYTNFASSGSINQTNATSAYLLSNSLNLGIKKKKIVLNSATSWVYGEQQHALTNNDFVSTLDLDIYNNTPHFFYWALGNYNSSYSLKIISQYQGGVGAAYAVLDRKNATLKISDGILYEGNNLNIADTAHDHYTTFRNSLRVSFKFNVKDIITFTGVNFLQNSLSSQNDYIIKSNLALGFKLRKWLSLTTALNYNKYNRTHSETTLFSYGLTVEKYF